MLDFDLDHGALLLERVAPGANLKSVYRQEPDSAVREAITVLKKVMTRADRQNDGFIKLDGWFSGLHKALATDFPKEYAEKALELYREVSTDTDQLFLIHGDLHHENILSSYRERSLLIDPKGVIGHFGYDVGVFLNNHHWWIDDDTRVPARLNRAVCAFAEAFGQTESMVRKWAFCQMVLSWWWTYEEGLEADKLGLSDVWNI